MKIAVDFDEVVSDTLNQVINYFNSKNSTHFRLDDFFSYNWWEVWGGTKDEAIKIWLEFCNSPYYNKISPVKDASDSLKSLEKDNEIIILTSRSKELKEKTLFLIKKFFGNSTFKVLYTNEFYKSGTKTKADFCKDLGIPLIIEDHSGYSLECAGRGIRVILFDKPWNKKTSHKNIIRVSGWKEALEKISELNT